MKKRILLLAEKFTAIGHYAVLAALCWLLDMAVFLTLVHYVHINPFTANLLSGVCGASAAYYTISRRLFHAGGGFRWHKWLIFVGYNVVMIFVWSGVVMTFIAAGMWPALAKVMVLPLSFYANFLFMGWLQEGRVRWH